MTDHADRTHALYSASSSNRWLKCWGSIQRAAGMPSGMVSGYAKDGTEAHELLEYALVEEYTSAREAMIMSGLVWEHRFDTYESRLASVQDALDHIHDLMDAYASPDLVVYLETQFTFPTNDNDDCGGTSDVTMFVPELDICVVADFKHGSGVAVDAVENSQAMMYAVGSRQELRRQGKCKSGKTLYRLMILQPRAFHRAGKMREWTCDDATLDAFIGQVNFAIAKTKERNPVIVPGSWCKWCPAVSACPEAEQANMRTVLPTYNDPATLRQTGLPEVASLSVDRVVEILEMSSQVIDWLRAVEAQAISLARQGVVIPGYKLVYAQVKSKWHHKEGDELTQRVIAGHLGALSGLPAEVFIRPKLITITDAKNTIKQAIYDRVGHTKSKPYVEEANKAMAPLMTRDTSGNLKLVTRDDKRPEVNIAALIPYTAPVGEDNDDE